MTKKMFVAAALAVVGSSAFAAGGYVEANLGATHVNQSCPAGSSCKNNQVGVRVLAGFYHLNPMLSAEVGYFTFGTAKGALSSQQQASPIKAKLESKALYTGLALRLPVDDDLSATLRLGAANVTTKLKGDDGSSADSTRTNLLWGMGVEYKVDGNWLATVALDSTKTGNPAGGGRGALTMVSAGVRYNF